MGPVSQALVRIVGDESQGVASLKRFNAAAEASQRKFDKDFGHIAATAQRGALVVGASFATAGYAIHRLNQQYDQLTASNRTLDSASKLTGTSLGVLSRFARTAADDFKLATPQANQFVISVSKLTAKAGDISRTSDALSAFINLGAAQGLTVDETLTAVQQAILGIDEGTDKLFQKNPSVLYAEFAAKIGTTAAKLTDAQKAQALVNAAMEAGNRVGGAYSRFLETAAGKQQVLNNKLTEAGNRLAEAWQPTRVRGIELLTDAVDDLASTVERHGGKITAFFELLAGDSPGYAAQHAAERAGVGVREGAASLMRSDRNLYGGRGWGHVGSESGTPLRTGSNLSPLGGGMVRFGTGLGLAGGASGAFGFGRADAVLPTSGSTYMPFPESPAARAARERADAAAEAAAKARERIAQESGRFAARIAEMRSELPTVVGPSLNDLLFPTDINGRRTGPGAGLSRMPERLKLIGDKRLSSTYLTDAQVATNVFNRSRESAPTERRTLDYIDAAGSAGSMLMGMSRGGSTLGGLGGLAGIAAGLTTGGASTALQGTGVALGLLQQVFGTSRQREDEMYRAQLRALREARREEMQITIVMPKLWDAKDPAWRELSANTLLELTDGRQARIRLETRE